MIPHREIVALLLLAAGPRAQEDEHRVKARMLLTFAKLVDWPEGALGGKDAPFVFAVLGEDPFGVHLERALQGQVVRGHKVQLQRFASWDKLTEEQRKAVGRSHLLFVGSSEEKSFDAIARFLARLPVLTVGEHKDFTRRGGCLRFFPNHKTIGFEVHLGVLAQAGLNAAARMLQLARILR